MSNIINKIQNKLPGIKREYEQKIHFYNPATAAYYSVAMYLCKFGIRKHQGILEELPKRISATLEKYSSQRSNIQEEILDDCPIWMMWWQGVDEMPPIVKRCYQSVLKHRGNHPVMLLDRNNYQEYIEITPPILEKLRSNGWVQYISDIIRFGLLSQYGGIWLDATILVSQDITGFNGSLYSIRHRQGQPRFVLNGDKWSSFMFASTKNHLVTSFIYDSLIEYFTHNDYLIDYWLTDYIIATLYLHNDNLRKYFDVLPLDNPSCLELLIARDMPFNEDTLKRILNENRFNKLDWRLDVKDNTLLKAALEYE